MVIVFGCVSSTYFHLLSVNVFIDFVCFFQVSWTLVNSGLLCCKYLLAGMMYQKHSRVCVCLFMFRVNVTVCMRTIMIIITHTHRSTCAHRSVMHTDMQVHLQIRLHTHSIISLK